MAARFVQAIGASGSIVLGRAIVRDIYEGARAGRELSRMSTIAAPIDGGLLQKAFGWRSNFAACMVFSVALGLFDDAGVTFTWEDHRVEGRARYGTMTLDGAVKARMRWKSVAAMTCLTG